MTARAAAVLFCLAVSGIASGQGANPLGTLIFESAKPAAGTPAPGEGAPPVPANGTAEAGVSAVLPGDPVADTASVAEYRAAILETIDNEGLYSQLLSEQYESLGVLLFRAGNFEEAITAFEEAMHIQKVNKGLFNLDQTRLVEHLVSAHIARGNFVEVDNHKHYLYYLQEKNLAGDDPRLIAGKLDWADWNVEAYVKGYRETFSYPVALSDSMGAARGIRHTVQVDVPVTRTPIDNSGISSPGAPAGETITTSVPVLINVPLLNSNSVMTNAAVTDYNLRSVPLALSNDIVVNQRLHEAEDIYESVLEQVESDGPGALQEQKALHLKLANISYLLKKELDQYENIRDPGSLAFNRVNNEYTSDASMIATRRYVRTKNAFEDLVRDIGDSPASTVMDKAEAWIALGDLHLGFERPKRAFDAYATALELLVNGGYSQAEAERILSPAPDVAVPAFGIHNYSREFFGIAPDTEIPFRGHIDVAFNKDRQGSLSKVNVVGSSEDTPAQVRSALVDYLRNQRFRPAFSAGESVEQQDIRLRYYYYY